jgi:hypothetical protein
MALVRVNRVGRFQINVHAANRILNLTVLSINHIGISIIRPSGCLWQIPTGRFFCCINVVTNQI